MSLKLFPFLCHWCWLRELLQYVEVGNIICFVGLALLFIVTHRPLRNKQWKH